METIRCGQCGRKLAEADYVRISIKCPRCGTINQVMTPSHPPERQGASSKKVTLHAKRTNAL
ncbi:MAG: Com family DNA-binding transcriptional regulator [Candidatus Accumulibacter sp.]|nr:Com family DNA-binding transcriptional regulator [Accumulibacter sp.]